MPTPGPWQPVTDSPIYDRGAWGKYSPEYGRIIQVGSGDAILYDDHDPVKRHLDHVSNAGNPPRALWEFVGFKPWVQRRITSSSIATFVGLETQEPFWWDNEAPPGAIGWQLRTPAGEVSPVWYDDGLWYDIYGNYDGWDAWYDSAGWDYEAWQTFTVIPPTSSELYVQIWGPPSNTPSSIALTIEVGITTYSLFYPSPTVPFIAANDVADPMNVLLTFTNPVVNGQHWTIPIDAAALAFNLDPLPAPVNCMTARVKFTPPGSTTRVISVPLIMEVNHYAPANDFRWLMAAGGRAIPLRQNRRTDGLVGAGRQRRPTIRQRQLVR